MFFGKKGKMDELKKTGLEQVEEQVEELTDDQLESVTGGFTDESRGVEPPFELELDDAYDKFNPIPKMRD